MSEIDHAMDRVLNRFREFFGAEATVRDPVTTFPEDPEDADHEVCELLEAMGKVVREPKVRIGGQRLAGTRWRWVAKHQP